MSQTKVQLIAPIGVVTATTLETTGILTATTFVGDIAGTVTGITSTTDNLDVGIVTATAFVGDFTGTASSIVTGSNVTAGIITGTKFVGNATGTVSGLADDTNINVGILTSTSFVGDLTGNAAGLSTTNANLSLGIVTATSFAGNITGNAAGISVTTTNANLGIITASAFHGSGANLDGVSSGPVAQQAVTANGATTTIDLSSGNLIYMTQSANTTVAFANTEGNTDVVYLVRVKDDNTTERTITWPSGLTWNGGSEPTLLSDATSNDAQVFKLTTRDNGATWYGAEVYNNKGGYTLWSWGSNTDGTLAQNDRTDRSSPVQIGTEDSWFKLSGSNGIIGGLSAAIKSNSSLWAWGNGYLGVLGLNDQARRSSPVQVPGTTWNNITVSKSSMGVKTDGTLWSWGPNVYGNLGQNNRTGYSSPKQVGSGTDWSTVGEGNANAMAAIKTDGTLWISGTNGGGLLGQNQASAQLGNLSSPTQIPGTWSKITIVQDMALAIQTDGTLWSWGYGTGGGHGDYTNRSSPTKIGSGTDWDDMAAGYNSCAAIKTDGTLWTWGQNTNGSLGLNDTTNRNSPVQVPGTTWKSVEGSYNWMTAVKTDGTLWSWGYNGKGQFGINDRTTRSSPVQLPGTNWNSVSVTKDHVTALRS